MVSERRGPPSEYWKTGGNDVSVDTIANPLCVQRAESRSGTSKSAGGSSQRKMNGRRSSTGGRSRSSHVGSSAPIAANLLHRLTKSSATRLTSGEILASIMILLQAPVIARCVSEGSLRQASG